MKICHIITGLNPGGAETVLSRVILYDKQNDHFVISLTNLGIIGNKLRENDIEVYFLNINFLNFFYKTFKIGKLLMIIKPDVIQTWMYHADFVGGIIGRFLNHKHIIWNIRNSTFDNVNYTTMFLIKILALLSYIIPNKIVSCSKTAILTHKKIGFKKDKFILIENGIDPLQFQKYNFLRTEFRKKLGLSNSTFLIGCVARYHPQKDHFTLLNAFKNFTNLNCNSQLLLVGEGVNINQKLNNYIDKLGLNKKVSKVGYIKNIEMVYNSLDLHVLCSSSGEGFPNVIIESLSCGTLSLASDIGDSKYIINNAEMIFTPKDVDTLSTKFSKLYYKFKYHRKEWQKLTEKSMNITKTKYSVHKMISKYIYIWNKS